MEWEKKLQRASVVDVGGDNVPPYIFRRVKMFGGTPHLRIKKKVGEQKAVAVAGPVLFCDMSQHFLTFLDF